MESVMNFLADNYVWFFVAAGVLCFALIGFIIESRKKQKSEFKGESIEENTRESETTTMNTDTNTNTIVETPAEIVSEMPTAEPVVEPTPVVTPITPEPTLETIKPNNTLEETMEINDIPINDNKPTSIEFYSGPIEMKTPSVEPSPTPVEETISVEPENNDTISYTEAYNDNSVNEPELIADEKKEETNNYDTF